MRIAAKLNAGILAVFAASVIANYCVLQATIKPKFDEIEIVTSKTNHKRVLDALDTLQGKHRSSVQDWGFWNDTYDYARGENVEEFLAANFAAPKQALDGLGIEILAIFDVKGALLWGAAFDLTNKEEIPGLVDELKALSYTHPFVANGGEARATSGLFKTTKGLMLLAAAPILNSERLGPLAGTIYMGSFLDEPAVQELTGVKFSLEDAAVNIPLVADELRMTTLDDSIATSSLIPDISGRPLVMLRASTPRDTSRAGAEAIRSATLLSIAAAALVGAVLWLLVNWMVVSRITALKKHFATAGEAGHLRLTDQDQANDEIGKLARSFNTMAGQVNHLRDALADTAYLSGMSEWASGTLHNVRNGLSPINVLAWKLQKQFDGDWLSNMNTAAGQYQAAQTADDRREKLASYLAANVSRVTDCAERTKAMAGEIMAASKSVEDIVAEYERFSRQQTQLETIDLLPLIKDVATTALAAGETQVLLTLPSKSAVVEGNRIIIRQILSNLFINALEAMENQSGERRINVELIAASAGPSKQWLSVSDNGEGIAPEDLNTIFQRGFSTRNRKHGGLGLHWCANAAIALGGSLHAESDGPGTGATLVLCLANAANKFKEAA